MGGFAPVSLTFAPSIAVFTQPRSRLCENTDCFDNVEPSSCEKRERLMKRFIEGEDRSQSTLFPEHLDDYIAEDNPVRVIDVFVDELDLKGLGFEGWSRK
jgi:hypothetical protein